MTSKSQKTITARNMPPFLWGAWEIIKKRRNMMKFIENFGNRLLLRDGLEDRVRLLLTKNPAFLQLLKR